MSEAGDTHGKGRTPVKEACLAAVGMCLFALFVHATLPLKFLSVSGLLVTTLAVLHGLKKETSPAAMLGIRHFSLSVTGYSACGALLGVILALFYQWFYGLDIHFPSLTRFAPLTALIGATEELLYRGYMQGRIKGLGPFQAAALAALCHTGYKLCLFVLPPTRGQIDFTILAIGTFGVGLTLGIMRHYTKSTLPPITTHACFDIVVYGGFSRAPWWVWY